MTSNVLYLAALLLLLVGFAHSLLGEKYILMRLFRRENLPKLFGGQDFTRKTLRFAWHLTTVAWLGLAAILVLIANGAFTTASAGIVVGVTFLIHGVVALVASRGRHLSWPVFLLVGLIAVFATRM